MGSFTLADKLAPPTVLGLEAWVECASTGLRAERVSFAAKGSDLPRLDGVIFLDKRGRVRQPPLMPYLPFTFTPTPTDRTARIYRQWISVAALLAKDITRRGIVKFIALPPSILDARPFQWAGLNVEIRYTFASALPVDKSQFDSSVRKNIRRAADAGYFVERTHEWDAVMACLRDTESAKGFSHGLDASSLASSSRHMGDETFRGYVVRNSAGAVASGGVRLHLPGGTAIDWVQGTLRGYLSDGVNQLMYAHVLDDLTAHGASGFDFGGANIAAVAAAKATWGMPLVPYLRVSGYDLRHAYRTARSIKRWTFHRSH